ncbi:MAG: hypothetical protein V8Q85_00640 [Christensenellales bacterium]
MTANMLGLNFWVNAIVFAQQNCETADHVFEDRQAFLNMVLTVHAQLRGAAAGCDYNMFVGASFYQGSSADDMAWVGPAQKPRVSHPVALFRPAISAAAFAKLPPPRWFISPQASSQQSIT